MQLDGYLNLEWRMPQGQPGVLLQQLLARIEQLEKTLNSRLEPVEAAVSEVLFPMADKLAIRCLLDVFLDQHGYSPQLSGRRRAWVADNKSYISQVSGIEEGDVEDLFQCVSLLMSFPSFSLLF
jgi:hypothetical protein